MSKGQNKRWPLIFFIDRLCCSASITTPLQQSLRITGHGAAPPPTYLRTKRTRKQINIYCVVCVIIRCEILISFVFVILVFYFYIKVLRYNLYLYMRAKSRQIGGTGQNNRRGSNLRRQ